MKNYEAPSGCLAAITGSIAIADLNNIINLIILVISLANIIFVIFCKIYDRIKDGKLTKEEINDTIKDIKDASEEVESLINKGKDKK